MVSPIGIVNYPSGNVYANFRNKYGVGPEDFGVRPYAQPYPTAIQPKPIQPIVKENWLKKLIRQCYHG